MQENTIALFRDISAFSNDWGAPSLTFREFQNTRNDFHIRRLNVNDWVSRLGFTHPEEYEISFSEEESTAGIDTYGDLVTLMYDTKSACEPPPKNQWVYISDYGWPSLNVWDAAFDEAVKAGYAKNAINDTRLFYIECARTGKFLCGVWNVRAPTLLHFSISDHSAKPEDIESGLTYSSSLSNLHPVTVRVIEFPLKDAYTFLPSTVFPSPREQMLAIMRGDRLYEQFESYSPLEQLALRFFDYLEILYDRKGTFLYHLGNIENWFSKHIIKSLGLKGGDEIIYESTILATYGILTLILKPYYLIKDTFFSFLGAPLFDEDAEDDYSMKEWNIFGGSFWGNMLQAFWANVTEELDIEDKKSYKEHGTTRAAKLPQFTEIADHFASIIPGL